MSNSHKTFTLKQTKLACMYTPVWCKASNTPTLAHTRVAVGCKTLLARFCDTLMAHLALSRDALFVTPHILRY